MQEISLRARNHIDRPTIYKSGISVTKSLLCSFKAVAAASACCALLLAPGSARADSTLVLELPPSPEALAMRAAEKARKEAERLPSPPAPRQGLRAGQQRTKFIGRASTRGFYASRGAATERVVGRLGQVDRPQSIFRSQSGRSSRLSTVGAGVYLAIQSESGAWYGVLMSDGTLGWIRREGVKLLEYQVVSNGEANPSGPTDIPGGYSDGLPAGQMPLFQGDAQALFREAYRYLGVPYHFGGNSAAGIDCSAFVRNVFGACGYSLPRHSSDQTAYGIAVPPDALKPGDRLYFGNRAVRNISHTGIYLGSGYFIHASSNSRGVAISHLNEALYQRMYICARR